MVSVNTQFVLTNLASGEKTVFAEYDLKVLLKNEALNVVSPPYT